MAVDIFPTDALMRALDEPGSLLDDLDVAGKRAAAAFDGEPGPTRDKVRAFQRELVADSDVPRAVRKRLVTAMPSWWNAITTRARDGRLSWVVAELEAESLLGGDAGVATASGHPVLAYVNEVGVEAAARAFETYRDALPPDALGPVPGTLLHTYLFEGATRAARERFAASLAARSAGDLFAFFQREAPPPVFWTTIVAAAAGALGTLILAPKLLTDAAGSVGLDVPPISADIDVGRIGEQLKIRFGGSVRVLAGALEDGPIWQQAIDSAFGATARVGLRFDDAFDLTVSVDWAPEHREWGAKLTFTLLQW